MRIAVLTFTFVLIADALTKSLLEVDLHPGGVSASIPLMTLALPLLAWRVTRIPATIALAGWVGNAVWTLNPGGVPNTFTGDGFYYNLADVCIVVGGYATVLVIFMHAFVCAVRRLA